MFSDEYVNKQYLNLNLFYHLLKSPFKLIYNFLRSLFIDLISFSNNENIKNKIILFSVSKNNQLAMEPLKNSLNYPLVSLTNDYRLRKNQSLLPMSIPALFSIFYYPYIFLLMIRSKNKERKRFIVFFEEITNSIGYNFFIKFYIKIKKPLAIIFTNDHDLKIYS